MERRNFRRRAQQEGEIFDDFLVSLRELAKTCNFCNQACTNKNLRDQIVQGLVDGDTVEELLKERTLTLDTAIAKCRASKAAKRQRAEITNKLDPTVQSPAPITPRADHRTKQTILSRVWVGPAPRWPQALSGVSGHMPHVQPHWTLRKSLPVTQAHKHTTISTN